MYAEAVVHLCSAGVHANVFPYQGAAPHILRQSACHHPFSAVAEAGRCSEGRNVALPGF